MWHYSRMHGYLLVPLGSTKPPMTASLIFFFRLCKEHENYQMPCYILKLPPEVRLMIFGYLFPYPQVAHRKYSTKFEHPRLRVKRPSFHSLLLVNHQISQEAFSIMYETVPYCFQISEEIIRTPNRTAFTASEAEIGARPSKDWRIDLLSLPFARIRKFHVSIFVSRFGFSDLLGHREEEELSLYNVRDNVQRLVSILKEVPSIKELRVRASLLNIEWLDPESITAAEFLLNPFMCLRNISRPSLDNIQVGVISESDRLDAYFIGTKRTGTCYTPEVDFVVPHDILTSSSGYYEPVADLSGVKGMTFAESNFATGSTLANLRVCSSEVQRARNFE